jgi:axial budding pattern protein 2
MHISGHLALLGGFSSLLGQCLGSPTLSYPFNDQYPPVAHSGQAYSYQIPANTFLSPLEFNYSASGLPEWLNFDPNSRIFSGTTPHESSDQLISFYLEATDSTGGVTNSTCNLQVSSASPPQLASPNILQDALNPVGPFANANSVSVSPGAQFTILFPTQPFNDSRHIIGYTALTSTHSPLPIWINFDPTTNKFTGTAPAINSQIAPAEAFGVSLIMIDYQSFSSGELDFQLLVGAHQFSIDFTSQTINAITGTSFEYNIPLANISLDGIAVSMDNISSITVNNTDASWLTLNKNNGSLSGTANSTASFQLTLYDSFQDMVQYTLVVNVEAGNIFSSESLNSMNVSRGSFFSYSLDSFIVDKNASINVTSNPNQDWLSYNSKNFSLIGNVPSSFQQATINLVASDGLNNDTASMTIFGVDKKASTTSSSTPPPSPSPSGGGSSRSPDKKTVAIVCGVVIPVCVLAALGILFCCRRQRRPATRPISPPPKTVQISGPILPHHDMEKDFLEPVPSIGTGTTTTQAQTPDKIGEKEGGAFWADSPQRASTFNFMRMDGDIDDYHSSAAETHVDDFDDNLSVEDTAGQALTLPGAETVRQRAPPMVKPRNSWRQTNGSDKRWQEHESVGSLATISTDELLTVRLVDRDSYSESARSSFMDPTRSQILTPRHSVMPSDGSSVLRPIGSHSSSISEHAGLQAVQESPYQGEDGFTSVESFRTAASDSADDDQPYEDHSSGNDIIRPYRNSRGEMTLVHGSVEHTAEEDGRDSGKLVDIQGRYNANETAVGRGLSGELAFL